MKTSVDLLRRRQAMGSDRQASFARDCEDGVALTFVALMML